MAGLRKPILFGLFEDGLRASGWRGVRLTPASDFPARYDLTHGDVAITARLYIWTISHGGGAARADDEYRIQLLKGAAQLPRFDPEPDGKTLIMGWWPTVGVFAGFDYNHHTGPLGKSPSIQVGEDALRLAAQDGMAVHTRGNGEIVIAFRPEFLGTYIGAMEDLHRIGLSEREVALLGRIAATPDAVAEEEIEAETAPPRRRAMATVQRAVRAAKFSSNVLSAYGHRCAFCGVQLRLLDAAHILPVAHPGGVDRTDNGVAVCTLHHRAYDQGLITFDTTYRVHVNAAAVRALEEAGIAGGLGEFQAALLKTILLPTKAASKPKAETIREANKHRGWKLSK